MDSLAKTLNDIQPIIIVGSYLLYYIIETFIPFFARQGNRWRHTRRNLVMAILSFVIYGALGVFSLAIVNFAAEHKIGIVNWLHLPFPAAVAVSVVLMDLLSYLVHNLQHRVPFLWRFHRVHHSDARLDVTTSLRFHPIDTVLTNFIQYGSILIVGTPMLGFGIYGVLLLLFLFAQHADIAWPRWADRALRVVFSVPSFHKLHHSSVQDQTDSNFADMINLWDRVFGTYRDVPDLRAVRYGLVELDEKGQTIAGMLKTPLFPV